VQDDRVPLPAGAENFSLRCRFNTGSGAHTTSYEMRECVHPQYVFKVKLSLRLTKHHVFSTSALDEGGWLALSAGRFTSEGKSPQYPLDRRLGGPQSRSGGGGKRKIPDPCRKSNPDRPARSLVAIPIPTSSWHGT
jgi:hypothetical protein